MVKNVKLRYSTYLFCGMPPACKRKTTRKKDKRNMDGMVFLDEKKDMEAGTMGKINETAKADKTCKLNEAAVTGTMKRPDGNADVLDVKGLVRNYQKTISGGEKREIKVLKGLDFTVKKGEFLGIMGKSGCGKTTLLKVLGLIDKQTDGIISFTGKDTNELYPDELADIRRTQIGFVFQDFYLMDSLSVKENIMLPMILSKEKSEVMSGRALELAEQFQIEELLDKDPYELSGGEKQRVAICRALVNNPDLILADEPTGNLDSKSGTIVIEALDRINREYGKTVVMVTHDPKMAGNCKKIILLKDGMILETLERRGEDSEFYCTILDKMSEL